MWATRMPLWDAPFPVGELIRRQDCAARRGAIPTGKRRTTVGPRTSFPWRGKPEVRSSMGRVRPAVNVNTGEYVQLELLKGEDDTAPMVMAITVETTTGK